MTTRASRLLFIASMAVLGFAACDESVDDENDIIVTNASSCGLASITLDGVDQGPISTGETREFEDVSDGRHVIQGFLEVGQEACDSEQTDDLEGRDDAFVILDCSCD